MKFYDTSTFWDMEVIWVLNKAVHKFEDLKVLLVWVNRFLDMLHIHKLHTTYCHTRAITVHVCTLNLILTVIQLHSLDCWLRYRWHGTCERKQLHIDFKIKVTGYQIKTRFVDSIRINKQSVFMHPLIELQVVYILHGPGTLFALICIQCYCDEVAWLQKLIHSLIAANVWLNHL